jgi:diphthamide synthase (EF-2-diphthine--ammonia ligase)
MTSISEDYRRISHHGVREDLLEQQAEAIGMPLEKIYLPSGRFQPCTNEIYEQIMGDVMAKFCARGVRTVAFGDLFLEDLRAWREANLTKAGMHGVFPIWKWDTTQLARDLIAMGGAKALSLPPLHDMTTGVFIPWSPRCILSTSMTVPIALLFWRRSPHDSIVAKHAGQRQFS